MNLAEKVAYLKGLAEGMELEDKKQGKLLLAMIDTLDSMAQSIADNEAELTELTAQVDEIDEDLAVVEGDFYGEEDNFFTDDEDDEQHDHCDCGCEDEDEEEEFYEVECPECGETIYLDEELLKEEFIVCPNCNTEIELEFEDDCECECDCEECEQEK